jgi:hypothetical protein
LQAFDQLRDHLFIERRKRGHVLLSLGRQGWKGELICYRQGGGAGLNAESQGHGFV